MTGVVSQAGSYYPDRNEAGNKGVTRYVKCHACFGSGLDRHGLGDCIDCEGYGDIEVTD